jgi:hypothetical protein
MKPYSKRKASILTKSLVVQKLSITAKIAAQRRLKLSGD